MRRESERIIRAQPFFADAQIRVVPVAPDTVELVVATEEELRPNVGLRIEGGQLTRLRLGSANFRGQAIAITGLFRKGFHYRDGFGIRLADYQPFGQIWVLNLEAIRDPLGSNWLASVREPFYTELHPHSWYVGAERRRAYHGFRRPDGADVSVEFDRTRWLTGAAWRIGTPAEAVFAGLAATGERSVDRGGAAIVTDTGIVGYDGPGLPNDDHGYSAVRAGALLGFHRIAHHVVYGFDGLSGPQDVRSGVEALALASHSLRFRGSTSPGDVLLGGSLYMGTASAGQLVALQAEGEARHPRGRGGEWEGGIVSARAAWYSRTSPGGLRTLSAEFSGGWRTRIPMQVTLSERDFGMRGFGDAGVGGERRIVARLEQRWVSQTARRRWDRGGAVFVDAGRLWAGQAPFGVTTPWQASAGAAWVGAVPRGARHVWRLELAIPLTNAGRPGAYEVRASIADFTRYFWRDPGDVARVREGPLLSRVLGAR